MEKIVVGQRSPAKSQDVLFHRTCKTFSEQLWSEKHSDILV